VITMLAVPATAGRDPFGWRARRCTAGSAPGSSGCATGTASPSRPHRLPVHPGQAGPEGLPAGAAQVRPGRGSSALTEVSGPILAPNQEFRYDGATYPITTVNPGADSLTVFREGFLFVNKGTAITDSTGFMTCTR
jgi:hypothetical protein